MMISSLCSERPQNINFFVPPHARIVYRFGDARRLGPFRYDMTRELEFEDRLMSALSQSATVPKPHLCETIKQHLEVTTLNQDLTNEQCPMSNEQ